MVEEEVVVVEVEEEVVVKEEEEAAEMEKVEVKVVETGGGNLLGPTAHVLRGSLFGRHLPAGGEAGRLLSLHLSHLCTRSAHIITHPTPLRPSACHPHGVTVMLALPLPSVCHVVSLLLCNFLLLFFFFLSSPRSRKECVSCRSAARCQGV